MNKPFLFRQLLCFLRNKTRVALSKISIYTNRDIVNKIWRSTLAPFLLEQPMSAPSLFCSFDISPFPCQIPVDGSPLGTATHSITFVLVFDDYIVTPLSIFEKKNGYRMPYIKYYLTLRLFLLQIGNINKDKIMILSHENIHMTTETNLFGVRFLRYINMCIRRICVHYRYTPIQIYIHIIRRYEYINICSYQSAIL